MSVKETIKKIEKAGEDGLTSIELPTKEVEELEKAEFPEVWHGEKLKLTGWIWKKGKEIKIIRKD